MEFLEFLLLFAAVMLIIMKPEKEKLAWWLTVGSWFVVVFMYVGHVSPAILGSLIFNRTKGTDHYVYL